MSKIYFSFFFCLLFLSFQCLAQNVTEAPANTTASPKCPGVPGACGYPPSEDQLAASENGNGTLGQTYNFQKCGLNFTQASNKLGRRGSINGVVQPAAFVISGIPPCAVIEQAYVWSSMSGTSMAHSITVTNPLGNTGTYAMATIGTGADKCWGYGGTTSYRADVTAIISGNGTYTISGFPTNPPTSNKDTDGATLFIIYSDPTATYRGHIIIHDGCVVINGGTTTQTVTGINACANSTNAIAFSCVGDLQMAATLTMNGTPAPFTWNWWNYTQVATTVTAAQATSNFTMASGGDCYNFAVAGLYYQTTSCVTCTSPALTLIPASTPASCSSCNGTASVVVTGGTAPYTYSWAPSGGTGSTATGLCAGTYTVTVSDASGCNTSTATVTVTSAAAGSITVSTTPTNVTCNALCNGSISTTVTGGTAPYTYSWAPSGGTGSTANSLCPGTYTVTVTDANGCTGTAQATITEPAALTATQSQTNVTCNAACNGSTTVTPSGGTAPYTYSWAPSGGTGATASSLCAGTYTCTITDANGCTITQTFTITQPPALTAAISASTNVTCNALCNGSATVTATGGTAPYTYSWAPSGGTGATASSLCAGTYTVTVTDANGCTATANVTITQPPALIATISASANVTCNAACDGSATVSASGGTGTYTYSWAPSGGTGATASSLCAGTYTVTVTDANGCTATANVTITQPPALTATISASANVTCNAACDGSATVSANGGTGTYTYSWAPSGGTGATASSLCAGTYTVTVTDANGCTATANVTITQPPALTVITNATQSTCGNPNGTVTSTPAGGTPPYTYSWSTSPVQSTQTATGLLAGTYTVTVTDASGCTVTGTATVASAGAPVVTITGSTNITCNAACDGTISTSTTGGASPYTYSWAPAGTGANPSGLCAGTYTVTVTDANGCTGTASVTITEPPALTAAIASSINVSCNAACNGTATVNASGGSAPYSYSWTPSGGTGTTASGLCAGNYTVTITDVNSCTATASITITEPPVLAASVTQNNVSCNGGSDGSATVTATGGTSPYTYSWNTTPPQTTATASNLPAGTYTVTVTDASCAPVGPQLVMNGDFSSGNTGFSSNYTYCNGPNCISGSGIYAIGNNANYYHSAFTGNDHTTGSGDFMIINGASTAGVSVWCQTVNVTPNTNYNFSTWVSTLYTTSPAQLQFSINNVPIGNVFNAPAATGTWSQFNAIWNSGSNTTATICILNQNTAASGNDFGLDDISFQACGTCTTTATVTITEPTPLLLTTSSVNASCGNPDGSATVNPSGGTPGYTYSWNTTPAQTSATATNLLPGTYSVTVTDLNTCTSTATVTVGNNTAGTVSITSSINVSCFNGNDGSATAVMNGGTGPFIYTWTPTGGNATTATGLTAGSYTVTVTDANSCSTQDSVIITEPTALTASITASANVTCNAACDGSATVTAGGGTPGYTYSWAPTGGTAATATGLCAGTYTVTVTDANACTDTAVVTITEPAALTLSVAGFDATCNGGCDGQTVVIPTGGTIPYAYSWSPGGCTTPSCNNLCAGVYSVTVTDANGCTATGSATVSEPPALVLTMSSVTANCNQPDGNASVSVTGGTPGPGGYSYSWTSSPVQTTDTATALVPGTYTVVVTDFNQCTATDSVIVPNTPGVTASISSQINTTCFAACDGEATVSGAGGLAPYTYSWSTSPVQTTATATGLCAGSYTCTITDASGCTDTAVVIITEPAQVVVTPASAAPICIGQSTGLSATSVGGTGTHTYEWNPGTLAGSPVTVSPVITTTYTVVATDANGCTSVPQTVTVIVNPPLQVIASGTDSVCPGGSASISATPSGGNGGPYFYTWTGAGLSSSTAQSPTATPVITTTYVVSVTDNCTSAPATDSVVITVNPLPAPALTSDIVEGCTPVTVNFNDQSTISNGSVAGWSWDFGDGSPASALQNPLHTYSAPGVYSITITATSDQGCVATSTTAYTVTAHELPIAEFTFGPQPATVISPEICFTNASVGLGTCTWDFGDPTDNTTSTDVDPCHTYSDTGTYCVTLYVQTVNGCEDSITYCLVIQPDFALYVPNAFTPNLDDVNDKFFPKGIGIKEKSFKLYIFDRWGNMIYYTEDMNNGWDGRANGGSEVAQQDVYVWRIEVTDLLDKKHSLIGHVTLIR